MEWETLKAYIKTHLKTWFIWSSNSFAKVPIFFNIKPDNNFYVYVDYQGLNNLTIKNQYLLLLIDKILDRLGWAKQFTQLDFIVSIIRWEFKNVTNKRPLFILNIITLSTRLCLLTYQILQLVFRIILIRSLSNGLTSFLWYIWIILWFISRILNSHILILCVEY